MAKAKDNSQRFSIKPLGDRIVVKPADMGSEKKHISGIIIPDTGDKEKPARGTVVAVGTGKHEDGKLVPMTVKVGDKVLFSKYGYDDVKIDGEDYYVLSEASVLGIIK